MTQDIVRAQREHLADLLEAIHRCVFFLNASVKKITWPLTKTHLSKHKKDVDLFESLSSINERFAKLQDVLGAAMRHGAILSSEPTETFLKVLSFYEKLGIIESIESWQLCITMRNLAAHDYGIDYSQVAGHFNSLHDLLPILYGSSRRLIDYCQERLGVTPAKGDFAENFMRVIDTAKWGT